MENKLFKRKGLLFLILGFFIKTCKLFRKSYQNETKLMYKALRGYSGTRIMIDVGAHAGFDLNLFYKDNWFIYAFEPDIKNRDALRKEYGGKPNFFIDSRAVSNINETNIPFYSSPVSTGISGLLPFHPSHRQAGTVDLVSLTTFCTEQGVEKIDFLKIDTEGFDLNVLKGVPWEKIRPRAILCEFENAKTELLGYTFHDLANFLIIKGYQVIISEWFPIKEYGRKHRWRRFFIYPGALSNGSGWGNIMAFTQPKTFEIAKRLCKL